MTVSIKKAIKKYMIYYVTYILNTNILVNIYGFLNPGCTNLELHFATNLELTIYLDI